MSAAVVRKLAEAGLDAAAIVVALEAFEAAEEERKAKARERKRRQREREAAGQGVTSRDVTGQSVTERDPSFPPSPPTPPSSTNLSELPPIVPQKPVVRRASKAPSTDELAERVWQAANKTSRGRSGRDKVRPAVAAAIAAGATPESLIASVKAVCDEGGAFAKGLHLILNGEHWRDYGPKPPPGPPPTVTPEIHQQRLLHLKETNEWRESWGPRPERTAA